MLTVVSKLTHLLRSIIQGRSWAYPEHDWQRKFADYDRFRYYITGEVFKELADPEDAESPLRYPLKINLCEDVADIETSYFWGEHGDDDLVQFNIPPLKHGREQPSELAQTQAGRIEERLTQLWRNNKINSMLDQAYYDSFTDGGIYFRQRYDPALMAVQIQPLLAQYVFPRWHPLDLNKLLEVVISFEMLKSDAKDLFGIEGDSSGTTCLYWEKWTPFTFEQAIDNVVVEDRINPYGFIPIVYIPRLRTGADFYGRSGVSPLIGIQNQINERMADLGDGINYNSHPIRWVKNYPGNVDEMPLGADALWDLGTETQTMGDPEVGVLESRSDYQGATRYIQTLVETAQDLAHVPPIARGRDEGSQRSGVTLIVRMLPLVKMINRVRIWWNDGLTEISRQALVIDATWNKRSYTLAEVYEHLIRPKFWPILPKDEQVLVDQNIALVNAALKHPIDAMTDLGDTNAQENYEKIMAHQREIEGIGGPRTQFQTTRRIIREGV